MKKRVALILAAALCLCFLTGAACDHDWQSAEASGPMVCAKCQLSECEAMGHSFEVWDVNGDSMSALCSVCCQNLVEDFDPQVVGEHRLVGSWKATTFAMDGMEIDFSDLGGLMSVSITFEKDHTLFFDSSVISSAQYGGEDVSISNTGTWEFDSYDQSNTSNETYNFKVLMDVPENLTFETEIEGQDEYNHYTLICGQNLEDDVLMQIQTMLGSSTITTFERIDAPLVQP